MTPPTDLAAVRAARDAEAHRRAVAAAHPSIARYPLHPHHDDNCAFDPDVFDHDCDPCPTCNGTGFVLASDWYGDDWTGRTDADIPCPEECGSG